MYRGLPLTNGNITFFPDSGRPITVLLSSEGDYAAELPAGEYAVAINVGAELPPDYKEGDPLPPPKIILPPQYTTRARSTLKATVAPRQAEPINFDLK